MHARVGLSTLVNRDSQIVLSLIVSPTPFRIRGLPWYDQKWIDHKRTHETSAYYLLAFDEACGDLLNLIGLTHAHKKSQPMRDIRLGTFTFHYARELLEGDPIRVTNRVIDCDPKRVHFWQEMYHADEGYLAAQSEAISLHIDMTKRRVAPMGRRRFRASASRSTGP